MASSTFPKNAVFASKTSTIHFADRVAKKTMQLYYTSEDKAAGPTSGYCIPVEPETRLTDSPTGGVIGRLLAVPLETDIRNTDSADGSSVVSTRHDPAVNEALQQHGDAMTHRKPEALRRRYPDGSGGCVPVLHQLTSRMEERASPDAAGFLGSQDYPQHVRSMHPRPPKSLSIHRSLTSRPQTARSTSAIPIDDTTIDSENPALTSTSTGNVQRKQISPEDREFLMKKLEDQVQASEPTSMTLLIPVHQDRPGRHILRVDRRTGQLYACIPFNPYAPSGKGKQQDYNLDSYDSFFQDAARASRRALKPYPAVGSSSLNTCNHCGVPTKVLNNDSLCPFHAYYLATGAFIGYYEFCALVEMEKTGLSITSGWWTVRDMVQFVTALTERINKWFFLKESTAVPEDSWEGRVSPYGAIGRPVPLPAQGKTPYRVGTEQKMAQAAGGRHAIPISKEKSEWQIRAENTLAMVMDRQTGSG